MLRHLLSSGAGRLACLRCSQTRVNHEVYGSGPEGLDGQGVSAQRVAVVDIRQHLFL